MKPEHGIAVDGYCKGNPGKGGYKGVDIKTGEILFKCDLKDICTNNIAEFIGLVHALMYVKKTRIDKKIYTDSEIAIGWVRLGQARSNMEKIGSELAQKLWKCEVWLSEQKKLPNYDKWKTNEWGEIPADFGHKK